MILNGGLIRFQDKTHYSIFHYQIYRLDLKAIIFIIYLSKYETSNLYIHTHTLNQEPVLCNVDINEHI